MKRFIITLIAISLLVSCSSEVENASTEYSSVAALSSEETELTKPENDITIDNESISMESVFEESVFEESDDQNDLKTDFVVIKSPYSSLDNNARNPWDMVIHNGYLYVGGGDFDENISPQKAYRYDLEKEEWVECGAINDEQIDRFLIFDGELYIPGTDPTEGWEKGNFYKLENGVFKKYRTIPNGVHCFDMALFDGKLFASLGVTNETFPIVVSDDGGLSFKKVEARLMDKNFAIGDRIYNLFVFKNELFAFMGTSVYKYNGKKFEYFADWSESFVRGIEFYSKISAEAEFCGKMFFTTGYLFKTDSMAKIDCVDFGQTLVSDITVFNNELYVLCNEFIAKDHYRIVIKKSTDGESFERIYEFEYSTIGLSLAFSENELFVGMGEISKDTNAPKGDIIKINIKNGDE